MLHVAAVSRGPAQSIGYFETNTIARASLAGPLDALRQLPGSLPF